MYLFWLISLIDHGVFRIHPCCNMYLVLHTFLLFNNVNDIIVWVYLILFLYHELMDICVFSNFWLLRIMVLWTLYTSFCMEKWFYSFGYIHRDGIAGLYGNSMFYILRNWHTVFQSNCTLHSNQQYIRVPISQCPSQRLLFVFFS